ncbi:MAG: adenosylmethionine decarboxylase [Chloroflexi bacterium]|nr:adenosylmethionine decarboxylase [Chloroflexota bacterium]
MRAILVARLALRGLKGWTSNAQEGQGGMHLVIDGYSGDTAKMQDAQFIYEFLDHYPAAIGMTKITQPKVITYDAPKHEDWGLSGFVIIAESHISIHTFPARYFLNLDVFSCREFDPQHALEELKATFSLTVVRSWTMERGLEHYSPEAAQRAIELERQRLAGRPG